MAMNEVMNLLYKQNSGAAAAVVVASTTLRPLTTHFYFMEFYFVADVRSA